MHFTLSATPNPNAMKFTADHLLFPERMEIAKGNRTSDAALNQLIATDGVSSIFCCRDFITVCKRPETAWDDLLPDVTRILDQIQ